MTSQAPHVVRTGTLRTHPAWRLDRHDGRWRISHRGERKAHLIDSVTAAICVLAGTHAGREEITADLVARGVAAGAVETRLAWLLRKGYLQEGRSDSPAPTAAPAEGWAFADQYHEVSYGYPFEYYTPGGGSREDVRRMTSYVDAEVDDERGKSYDGVPGARYQMPNPAGVALELPADDAAADEPVPLTRSSLLDALALLVRPVAEAQMPWPNSAKVLRKTSPSGGSRHPSEVYAHVGGVPDLRDGVYHLDAISGRMQELTAVDDRAFGELIRPGGRGAADMTVDLLFTSVFRRNRFRYREPRTFRTVHMDVGHLLGTTEFILRRLGMSVEVVGTLPAARLADHLGLRPLTEYPLALIRATGR